MLAFIISFLYVQINYSTLRTLSSFLVDSDWSHVESNTVLKKNFMVGQSSYASVYREVF